MALIIQMTKTIVEISTRGDKNLVTRLMQRIIKEINPTRNFHLSGIVMFVLAAMIPKTNEVPQPKKFCRIHTIVSLSAK